MIEIIKKWNTSILNEFGDICQVSGLAIPIIQKDGEDVFYPAVISEDGEGVYVFVDDNYRFGIYHRLIGIDYTTQTGKGYGDGERIKPIADILLVCWGFLDFTTANELERKLFNLSPKEVRFTISNFDRKHVFAGEFSGITFNLPPEIFLFSIRYKVQFSIDKNCK